MKDAWSMAYHRIQSAKENNKPCDCKECREYMASKGLDTRGRELTDSAVAGR